jgi:ribosomal protein S2
MHKTASFDLQELIKSLKQTLRLVQFVSKNENQILVCSSNKQSLKLLNFELALRKKGKVNIKSGLTKTVLKNISQVLFLLEDPLLNKKFSKAFEDKIYLVNKINLKVEQTIGVAYKVNNDLNSFKINFPSCFVTASFK